MKKYKLLVLLCIVIISVCFLVPSEAAISLIVTANPVGNVYSYTRVVELVASDTEANIYFTLDGSAPNDSSTLYTSPIVLMTSRTIKFFARDELSNTSPIYTEQYDLLRVVTVPAMNAPAHIREFDIQGNVEENELTKVLYGFADPSFRGGANIATGDVDNDDQDEIVIAPGSGMEPRVEVYDQDGEKESFKINAYHPDYHGGVDVAVGDLTGDGRAEIVTVNTSITEADRDVARVKVYSYEPGTPVLIEFIAFGSAVAGGRVTLGDIDADGDLEIIVAANKHGGPIVRAFELDGSVRPTQFFTYHTGYRGGIDVAAGDIHGNGKDEIVVVPLVGEISKVKVYRFRSDQYIEGEFNAFGEEAVGGNVEMADIDQDGEDEIIIGTQNMGHPQIKAFEYDGTPVSGFDFYAYPEEIQTGVSVAILKI